MTSATAASATKGPESLWRNREYVRYRAGRVVSILGSHLSGLALPLLVLALGGSVIQVGLLSSSALVMKLASQLPAGYLADRYSRRELMIITDLVRVVGYGSIPMMAAFGHLGYAQLLIIAIVDGAGAAVFSAAATATLRDLVPPAQITRAMSQTQATAGSLGLIGPLLGGLCFAVWPMLPFTLDACSYLLSGALIATLARRPPMMKRGSEAAGDARPRLDAGLRWMWHKPKIMRTVCFAAAVNLAGAAIQVVTVVGLRERGDSSAVIGVVLACSGIGLVSGAAVGWRLIAWLGQARLSLAAGTLWTLGLLACAIEPTPRVLGPTLAALFFLAPAMGIMMGQVTLGEAPAHLLGRVTAAMQLFSGGLAAIGPLFAGAAVRALGISPVWALLAALCLTTALITMVPLARGTGAADGAPDRDFERPAEVKA